MKYPQVWSLPYRHTKAVCKEQTSSHTAPVYQVSLTLPYSAGVSAGVSAGAASEASKPGTVTGFTTFSL